jgi:hypothetical protein
MISANKPDVDPSSKSTFSPMPGDSVFVRQASEIFDSLDDRGCFEGLPFMPEMLRWCGRKFAVQRIANKACIQAESVFIGSMPRCVILQMADRCDGSAHGGCQMGCKFLWRPEWLSPEATEVPSYRDGELEVIRKQLLGLASVRNGHFRCQATELVQIATRTSAFELGQYFNDIRSGIPVQQVIRFLGGLAARKVTRKSESVSGTCHGRTPAAKLDLKVGDRVRVKSLSEICDTLDTKGCNRGLWFDADEMAGFCEKELVVSRVLHRLIDEKSGNLRELKTPCVVLSESECSGVFRRFCSRGMLHFWREVWLTRAS